MIRRIVSSCLIALAACGTSVVRADEAMPAVYQRLSTPAMTARTNWARHGGYWGGGWGWGYPGFYNPWFVPQFYGGTWHQRPYPDHLIYNNVRSGAQPVPGDCGIVDEAAGTEVTPER